MKIQALLAAAVILSAASAKADTTYNFAVSGSGITSSGSFAVVDVGGNYEITGINGTFSTTTGNPFSGSISGLLTGSYNASSPTSIDAGVLNYDNLFYPAGSPSSACGGSVAAADKVDLCGLAFTVVANSVTYDVNFYGATGAGSPYEALDTVHGSSATNQYNAPVSINFTAVTPEPSTWLLTLTGVLAVAVSLKRRTSVKV